MPAAPPSTPPPALSRTSPWVPSSELPQVALPLGGLGAGHVSVNSYGGLQDFAIRHQPTLSALPDGWVPGRPRSGSCTFAVGTRSRGWSRGPSRPRAFMIRVSRRKAAAMEATRVFHVLPSPRSGRSSRW